MSSQRKSESKHRSEADRVEQIIGKIQKRRKMNYGAHRLKPIGIGAVRRRETDVESKASSSARSTMRDFQTLQRLGKGAFGEVFLVKRKDDREVYALKKVGIARMSNREIGDALNEIRLLASVKHPNIVRWYEAFVNERSMEICIVMEYADGGDLSHKIKDLQRKRQQMPEEEIWSYFIQLLDAIKHLHSNKILHRDLKTANCFLTNDGRLKVGDFNVSKLTKNQLQANTQIGTPYYMSPEIFNGRNYDDKSDMWSVGCIMYEATTLKVPFQARNIQELARKVKSGRYPAISRGYSRDLATVLSKLLQVNPKSRPSVSQLLKDPIIQKKREELRPMLDMQIDVGNGSPVNLLSTIKAPQNMRMHPNGIKRLGDNLPQPRYQREESEEDEDDLSIDEPLENVSQFIKPGRQLVFAEDDRKDPNFNFGEEPSTSDPSCSELKPVPPPRKNELQSHANYSGHRGRYNQPHKQHEHASGLHAPNSNVNGRQHDQVSALPAFNDEQKGGYRRNLRPIQQYDRNSHCSSVSREPDPYYPRGAKKGPSVFANAAAMNLRTPQKEDPPVPNGIGNRERNHFVRRPLAIRGLEPLQSNYGVQYGYGDIFSGKPGGFSTPKPSWWG